MSARGRGPVVLAKYVLEAVKKRKEVSVITSVNHFNVLFVWSQGEQKDYQDVIEQLSKKDIKVVLSSWHEYILY